MVGPLCTGLISAWFSLVGSKHRWMVPFGFETVQNCYTILLSHWLLGRWLFAYMVPSMVLYLPWLVMKCPFEVSSAWKYIHICVMQFSCYCFACHHICFFFLALLEYNQFPVIFAIRWWINFVINVCFLLILLWLLVYFPPFLVSLYCVQVNNQQLQSFTVWHPYQCWTISDTTKNLYQN